MLCVTESMSVFKINNRLSNEEDQLLIIYKLSFSVLPKEEDSAFIVCNVEPNLSENEPDTWFILVYTSVKDPVGRPITGPAPTRMLKVPSFSSDSFTLPIYTLPEFTYKSLQRFDAVPKLYKLSTDGTMF